MAALDSAELTWTVVKKNEKGEKVTVRQVNYAATGIRGFSIRLGVVPVSMDTCNLTVAIISLSMDELKNSNAEKYNKVYCPQIALIIGENNITEKPAFEVGMGILPIIQDVRSNEQIAHNSHPLWRSEKP